MEKITVRVPGKINLTLDILGRFANGYHDLQMVMSSVSLYDEITLVKKEEKNISVTVDKRDLPVDERNLAYRAAALLMEEFALTGGVEIAIKKQIPIAAGMAGGSADAAGVLKGMNRLFELGLELPELQKRGLTLGADVPFCLLGGCALAEGVGERLTPLEPLPRAYLVLAKPDFAVSTPWAFAQWDQEPTKERPDLAGMLAGIKEGDIRQIAAKLGNVLEGVTGREYPVIWAIKEKMKEYGALNALMTGSGPTVFGIYTELEQAQRAHTVIKESRMAGEVHVVKLGEWEEGR